MSDLNALAASIVGRINHGPRSDITTALRNADSRTARRIRSNGKVRTRGNQCVMTNVGRTGTGITSIPASTPALTLMPPNHWISGRGLDDVSQIPVQRLIGPAVVIDKVAEVAANPDYCLDVADIKAWEEENGKIPKGAWFLYRTGWVQVRGRSRGIC